MKESVCQKCGKLIIIDENGVANHVFVDDEIDYEQDADHVPIPEIDQ